MSKKKWCGLLAVLMAVSIVFTSGALRPVNVYAETIADLQEQSEEHQKKLEEINQQIEEAEAYKADAMEQKNLLDQQADVLRSQISNAQQQSDALEAELADNQQKEESQYDLFCRQVRDEEARGTASFWSVIFKATSFSDLLGRIDFINEVAEHDQSVINDLRQLRQQMQADRQALIEGILDGTVDMIAPDHAPHSAQEKARGLAGSAMGIVGLETAFPVLYTHLVRTGVLTLDKLVELMAVNPRKRFGFPLRADDYAVWDLNTEYRIDPAQFCSMGKSTPFAGQTVYGRCVRNVCGGAVVWQPEPGAHRVSAVDDLGRRSHRTVTVRQP